MIGIILTMCVFYVPTLQVAVAVLVLLTTIHVVVFNVMFYRLGLKSRIF